MNRKPIVGEILIAHTPKNRWHDERVEEAKVLQVGVKYFKVSARPNSRFLVESWDLANSNEVHNNPMDLYTSREEMDTKLTHSRRVAELRSRLDHYKSWESLSEDQVSAIHKIVFP